MGFAHQTFAESLAAAYLIPVPLAQIKTLLCQRDGGAQYVIPQLAEVSAWLADDHPGFLDFLLTNEPDVLLRTDLALIPDDKKERLLGSLLEKASNEEIFDSPSSERFYAGLKYPGMAGLLIATVSDKGRNLIARRMAMGIGGECREAELATPLLNLIRDASDEEALKRFAARALAKLMPEDRLAELVPLADGTAAADHEDEIKGAVLEALIPRHSSVGNAVPWLTRPLAPHNFGTYREVLDHHVPAAIVPADVPALLGLILDRSSCFDHTSIYKEIADKTVCEAIKLFDNPQIVDGFVAMWLDKVINGQPLPLDNNFKFNVIIREDVAIRRRIIEVVLTSPRTTVQFVHRLTSSRDLVLSGEDLPWFLERLPAMNGAAKANWVEAIRWQIYPDNVVKCWDAFLDAVNATPELQVHFADRLRPWRLDEDIAVRAKAEWQQVQAMAQANQRPRNRPNDELVVEGIATALAGNTRAWVNLSDYLFREKGTSREAYETNLDKAEGWIKAGEAQKTEIRGIARQFLIQFGDPRRSPNTVNNFTFAGFRAAAILSDEIRIDGPLRQAVHDKWMPALFDIYVDGDAHRNAVSLAFELDRGYCRERMIQDFAEDDDRHQFMSLLRALEKHWAREFSEVVIQLIMQRPTAAGLHNVLKFLAKVDRPAALDCFNWLRAELEIAPDAELLKNLLSAGISILTAETRPTIWPELEANPELAKSVLLQVAYHNDDPGTAFTLDASPEGLEKFYIQLRDLFPIEEIPRHELNGRRSSAARLRDQQISRIASLGTLEASGALMRLALRYPQDSLYIRSLYKECQGLARQKAWRPRQPGEILRLVERSANRYIFDEEDLMEVVLESLQRFEVSLAGTNNPQAAALWNYQGGGTRRSEFSPKDEEDLSGAIASWLQNDLGPSKGIILNREVQPILEHLAENDTVQIAFSLGADQARFRWRGAKKNPIVRRRAGQPYNEVGIIFELRLIEGVINFIPVAVEEWLGTLHSSKKGESVE